MSNIFKRVIMYIVSKKTKVQLDNMNFYAYVLITDDSTNPDQWTYAATDKEHVIKVKEIDKLLKQLQWDTRFGKCPVDEFFTDNLGTCQACSNALDALPDECHYFGEKITPIAGSTTIHQTMTIEIIHEHTSPTKMTGTPKSTQEDTWTYVPIIVIAILLIVTCPFVGPKVYPQINKWLNREHLNRNDVERQVMQVSDGNGVQEVGQMDGEGGNQESLAFIPAGSGTDSGHNSNLDGSLNGEGGTQETLAFITDGSDSDSGHISSPNGNQPSIERHESDSGNESEEQNGTAGMAWPDRGGEHQLGPTDFSVGQMTVSISDGQEEGIEDLIRKNNYVLDDPMHRVHDRPVLPYPRETDEGTSLKTYSVS
ncbi:uncharacterized protein LOC127845799 isoform X2 [Dreissena polymorpha]|uniref:uncharacterized protein LOC127845799 isoform X2 n=1 Tax=Dreissena polymorpha TaxID=45954 RepID=UPI0022647E84|nr:uncharacterized protein LOC127845799 isoform X2 [Dreissena polymorpha]